MTDGAARKLGRRGSAALGQVPLFSNLSRRHLRRLADQAEEASYAGGATIVADGDEGDTFYVILEGEAKVVRGNRTISRMGPGEFFGEISLLDGGPRTASVIADTPVLAARLSKRSFDRMVLDEPGLAAKLLSVVARRLREAERSIST
jgi:CRP/FNR family transcriptional regulator, cyclic AMP receptor protein